MSKENEQPDGDELPEGTEISENAEEFVKALALGVDSPVELVTVGIAAVNTAYGTLRSLAGDFGEMAVLNALASALLHPMTNDGLRVAILRAAILAEALESEKDPSEVATWLADRFSRVEEMTDFAAARDAWQSLKDASEEKTAEVDALEAAFALPDAEEPDEIEDEAA